VILLSRRTGSGSVSNLETESHVGTVPTRIRYPVSLHVNLEVNPDMNSCSNTLPNFLSRSGPFSL
jgi:hypothetical protein